MRGQQATTVGTRVVESPWASGGEGASRQHPRAAGSHFVSSSLFFPSPSSFFSFPGSIRKIEKKVGCGKINCPGSVLH